MNASTANQAGYPDEVDKWTLLAQTHWSKSSKAKKVNNEVVKSEIWDVLQTNGFEYRLLLILENLQLLEK